MLHTSCSERVCCVPGCLVCCPQKDLFVDKTGEYWGKFGATQQSIQQAYSGNAAANVDAASSGMLG